MIGSDQMRARRRAREAKLDAAEVARRKAAAKARVFADRQAHPEKYRALEAARYRRHEAARTVKQRRERAVRHYLWECRREVSRRPAFGNLFEELRSDRQHWVADDSSMSVWDRMLAFCSSRYRDHFYDERAGDAADQWLRSVPRGTPC